MHVRVVELMVAGVRRPREECLADPGTIGTLSIGDIPIGTAEKRPLHAAQLWERWGTSARRGLLPPLFDVQVLRITPRGLLLRGFQVDTSNRPNTAQHAQEWWAVPIEKPGAAYLTLTPPSNTSRRKARSTRRPARHRKRPCIYAGVGLSRAGGWPAAA